MKLFGCAISEEKITSSGGVATSEISIMSGATLASNEQEARGKAIENARKIYPDAEGYYGHQVSITEIPQHMIEQVTE